VGGDASPAPDAAGVDASTHDGTGGGADGAVPPNDSASMAPPDVALMRGPTPAANGVNFPFPQNRESSHCVYPARYLNSVVQAAYDQWKNLLLTSNGANGHLRVQRTSSDSMGTCIPQGSTVSEGIGYGMLLAVYMGDQNTFDQLWLYEQQNLDKNNLMNWAPTGPQDPTSGCTGGATDADEDMAFALAMAAKQWGGQGALSAPYSQLATQQAGYVWNYEILKASDGKGVQPGEWGVDFQHVNPSYFAPAYYRVFQVIDPGPANAMHTWKDLINTTYDTLTNVVSSANGNQTTGLAPGWCQSPNNSYAGPYVPGTPTGAPGNYQYDACRVPFRIGIDWCLNGEARAQSYVAKTSAFFGGIGVNNIADGYGLDGTPQPAHSGLLSAAFIGPAGVGAMSSSTFQPFVNDAYGAVATQMLLAGGTYYEQSWTVLSLLMMTANFLDYSAY
jgi:endo-1,4-beta-D-glucanase Y